MIIEFKSSNQINKKKVRKKKNENHSHLNDNHMYSTRSFHHYHHYPSSSNHRKTLANFIVNDHHDHCQCHYISYGTILYIHISFFSTCI